MLAPRSSHGHCDTRDKFPGAARTYRRSESRRCAALAKFVIKAKSERVSESEGSRPPQFSFGSSPQRASPFVKDHDPRELGEGGEPPRDTIAVQGGALVADEECSHEYSRSVGICSARSKPPYVWAPTVPALHMTSSCTGIVSRVQAGRGNECLNPVVLR